MSKKKPKKTEMVGKRIYLRLLEPADQEELIALNRRSKRLHRALVSPPTRSAEFNAMLERCSRPDSCCLLICRLVDEAIVGSVNLSQIFRGGFQSAYLGYYIGAEFAGQGFTSEAVHLVVKYAFERLRLHRLEANIQPSNLKSIAIVKRAGFVREGFSRRYLKVCGRWRDHERWAIIVEDWRAKRKTLVAG
jgi:ribosomal-protein-alanine N-acetyltransferase